MAQFHPVPQQQFEDIGYDYVEVVEELSFTEGMPATAPLAPSLPGAYMGARQYPAVTTEQLSELPHAATGQLEYTVRELSAPPAPPLKPKTTPSTDKVRVPTTSTQTPSSLTAALQATMSPKATGRIVIIPGTRTAARKQQTDEIITQPRRMSPRLRHGVVFAVLLGLVITSLLTLSPLTGGQYGLPILQNFGHWLQNPLGWTIPAHMAPAQAQMNNQQTNANMPPMNLPKSQYVAIAQQDAIDAGISPVYFVRQIYLESGFNPNAASPAGAIGIAQFLPSTAAGLGIDPRNPVQALRGAARLMASYAKNYGGDYAKALAAYNGGSGTVQNAVRNCGANWLNCLPGETRNYIHVIMGI